MLGMAPLHFVQGDMGSVESYGAAERAGRVLHPAGPHQRSKYYSAGDILPLSFLSPPSTPRLTAAAGFLSFAPSRLALLNSEC